MMCCFVFIFIFIFEDAFEEDQRRQRVVEHHDWERGVVRSVGCGLTAMMVLLHGGHCQWMPLEVA